MAKKTSAETSPATTGKQALKPLSIFEKTFLEHYLASNFNGAEAARRMGYQGEEGGKDDSNPSVQARKMLAKVHVQQHLELMRAERAHAFPNLLEKAMRTYEDILDNDRRDYFDENERFIGIKKLSFAQASAIRKIKFDKGRISEIEFESKKPAADASIDRLKPSAAKEGEGGGPGLANTPANIIINVMGVRIPQPSQRVLDVEKG